MAQGVEVILKTKTISSQNATVLDGESSNSNEEMPSYDSSADPEWVPHQELGITNSIIT